MSLSAIAKLIDVSKSTVSREKKKNSNMYRHYVAIEAQQFSEMRKKIPRRPRKLSKEDWQDFIIFFMLFVAVLSCCLFSFIMIK